MRRVLGSKPLARAWTQLRQFLVHHGLVTGLAVLVLAALTANVAPGVIKILFQAIGLEAFGQATVELLRRLTEGLVVLFLLAIYVEAQPFRKVENQLTYFQGESGRQLTGLHDALHQGLAQLRVDLNAEVDRLQSQVDSQLKLLSDEHLNFKAARVQLADLLRPQRGSDLGNLIDLVLPQQMSPVYGTTIEIHLQDSTGESAADDIYDLTYEGRFAIRQSEYIIGVVNSKGHQDRLRDSNTPIHEVFVLSQDEEVRDWSAEYLIDRFDVKFEYLADPSTSEYEDAEIEKVVDTRTIWQPKTPRDEFPLTLIRATFPRGTAADERKVRLSYRLPLSKREGFCFWAAARPIYVETLEIDASKLTGVTDYKFERFLPNFDRRSTRDVVTSPDYLVTVGNWLLKGHGVILTWQVGRVPPTHANGGDYARPEQLPRS